MKQEERKVSFDTGNEAIGDKGVLRSTYLTDVPESLDDVFLMALGRCEDKDKGVTDEAGTLREDVLKVILSDFLYGFDLKRKVIERNKIAATVTGPEKADTAAVKNLVKGGLFATEAEARAFIETRRAEIQARASDADASASA